MKKYIRGNNIPLMTKTFSKAIMQRTRFRNKFLKNTTDQSKLIYSKQRNFLFLFLEKRKKNIVQN